MALTRLNEFNTGTTLTEAALEGDFDNIYSNALTLISPLTGNLAAGGNSITGLALGSAASPSLQYTGDTNTGIYSSGADAIDLVGGGLRLITLTSTPSAGIVSIDPGAITATASTNVARLLVANTSALTIPAGTTTVVAGLRVEEPNLTATGTVTNAATAYFEAAPTEGTNNYTMWGDDGPMRWDGTIFGGTTLTLASLTGNNMLFGRVASIVPGALTEDMRLSAGVLALGTTVTTGANAGWFVQANTLPHAWVNAAGTGMIQALNVIAGNVLELGATATDIRWGKALVALGGGAAPTLGTIGGSGPATAGQNSWMRVLDSDGVAFWVPVWK